MGDLAGIPVAQLSDEWCGEGPADQAMDSKAAGFLCGLCFHPDRPPSPDCDLESQEAEKLFSVLFYRSHTTQTATEILKGIS